MRSIFLNAFRKKGEGMVKEKKKQLVFLEADSEKMMFEVLISGIVMAASFLLCDQQKEKRHSRSFGGGRSIYQQSVSGKLCGRAFEPGEKCTYRCLKRSLYAVWLLPWA